MWIFFQKKQIRNIYLPWLTTPFSMVRTEPQNLVPGCTEKTCKNLSWYKQSSGITNNNEANVKR